MKPGKARPAGVATMSAAAQHAQIMAAHAMDLMLRFGTDGRIAFASPSAFEVLGKSADEIVGRSLPEFVVGEDRHNVQTVLARTSYFGAEGILEFRVRKPDGSTAWVEMRCRPYLCLKARPHRTLAEKFATRIFGETSHEGAQPAAFEAITIVRDITARKQMELDLIAARVAAEQANQAKSRFLASMSHELRTPLNAIIGFSEMMEGQVLGPLGNERYTEYATHIHESGAHLLDLINDVLDLSKIEAGKFELDFDCLNVASLIDEVLTTISITAKQKGVALDLDLQPHLPLVLVDRRAAKQMLLNLLANAIKFTPQGGTVTLGASASGEDLHLEVRDTGVGIPADAIARLGKPFEQVAASERRDDLGGSTAPGAPSASSASSASGTPNAQGTGLGLALVKAFAGLHGGAMDIESEEGVGTRVLLTLPFAGPTTVRGSEQDVQLEMPFAAVEPLTQLA